MKTVNSLSGGKTSSYIAANYPADYNLFALVTTSDKKCMFPDKKLRQEVSDKIGREFIGTLEEDVIIHTMLDLEQFIGREIVWVAGKPFDEIIERKNGTAINLPTARKRYCTSEMKITPMFNWWRENIGEVVEMRIGFRANEMRRAKTMIEKSIDGVRTERAIIGQSKNGRNKWAEIGWQKPVFPLIDAGIFKDNVEEFWKDKPVRFAYMNNCIGCFHRNEVLLKLMSDKHPNKFDWFIEKEKKALESYRGNVWKVGCTYKKIKESFKQIELFETDFNECDSGYCGL